MRHTLRAALVLTWSAALLSCASFTYTRPLQENREKIMSTVKDILEEQGYTVAGVDATQGRIETRWKRHHGRDPEGVVQIKVIGQIAQEGPELKMGFQSEVEIDSRRTEWSGSQEPIWSSSSRDLEEEERLVMLVHMKLGMVRLR